MTFLNLEKLLKDKKLVRLMVVIGIVGVLIIFLSDFIGTKETTNTKSNNINSDDYAEKLSHDIELLVKDITGDKKVSVLVTLENGTEYIYATQKNVDTDVVENRGSSESYNNQTSDKTEESYIIINTGSGEQPLLLSTIAPSVRGVVVACSSGGNKLIAEQLKTAICVLLDISERKVSISALQNHY